MSADLLQSLLAIRIACAQLKAGVAPAQRARLDQVTTLLSKLIADERTLPALRQTLQQRRELLLLANKDGLTHKAVAQLEGNFARDCDAHVRAGERWFEIQGPPVAGVGLLVRPQRRRKVSRVRSPSGAQSVVRL